MSKLGTNVKSVSDVEVEGLLSELKLPEMRKRAKDDNINFVLRAVPLSYTQAKTLIRWKRCRQLG
jgi:hypothetical protein